MNKKITLLAFFIAVYAASVCAQQQSNYLVTIPKDFKIIAAAGGVAPGSTVDKVEIGANGGAVHYEMSAKNRAKGIFTEKERFKVEEAALRHIYRMIKKNDFFGLNNDYKAEDVLDGNFAELTVTMDGRTHSVRTRNIEVKRFDEIMIAINMATPGLKMVVYNEILQ